MSDVNIPRHVWDAFLQTFSERHAGWIAEVETHDRQTNETVASQPAALHCIELDVEDKKNPRINVTVLYDTKELKHVLFRPSQLTLHIPDHEGEDSLRISSLNTETTIRLRRASKADPLDFIKTLNVLDVVRDEAA